MNPKIVAGGNMIESLLLGQVVQRILFDLRIAAGAGCWRLPSTIPVNKIVYDLLAKTVLDIQNL